MKDTLARLLQNLTATFARLFGGKKPPPARCQFCGATDHDTNNCPNAAKYKLFNVDRE